MSNIKFVSEHAQPSFGAGLLYRTFLSRAGIWLFLAAAIFIPAGDIRWQRGWLFLLTFIALMIASVTYLWFRNPDILVARSKIHAKTKPWDKTMLLVILVSAAAIFPMAGLDWRYQWSTVPLWLTILGYTLLSFGFAMFAWVMGVNKFAEPTVRIQTERGHKVIDTGPYAFVRHPLYAAGFLLWGGVPLALGSYWALLPMAVTSLVVPVRTALEDRMLREELDGYAQYAQKVRYRLLPGVW